MNKYAAASKAAQEARRKRRTCTSKTAYETIVAAYQKGQETYQCPYCGKFHRSGKFSALLVEVRKINN